VRLFTLFLYIIVLATTGLIILDLGVRIAYRIDMIGYYASTNLSKGLGIAVDTSKYNFLMSLVPYLHILDIATAIAIILSIFAMFLYFKER